MSAPLATPVAAPLHLPAAPAPSRMDARQAAWEAYRRAWRAAVDAWLAADRPGSFLAPAPFDGGGA